MNIERRLALILDAQTFSSDARLETAVSKTQPIGLIGCAMDAKPIQESRVWISLEGNGMLLVLKRRTTRTLETPVARLPAESSPVVTL
jgi:hypothetical protein